MKNEKLKNEIIKIQNATITIDFLNLTITTEYEDYKRTTKCKTIESLQEEKKREIYTMKRFFEEIYK